MSDKLRMATYHASSWGARIILLVMAGCFPWWYGAAHYRAQVVLLWAGTAVALLTWIATLCAPKRTGSCLTLTWIMLAFLAIVPIQLLPLPVPVSQFVSGAGRFCAQVASSTSSLEAGMGEPRAWLSPEEHTRISIHPHLTQASLSVAVVALIVFWSASTLFIGSRWAIALCVVLACSGLLNGFLGVWQLVSAGRWTLLPMPPVGSSFATFVSRNSAPAFYASATGATFAVMGIAFRSQKRKRRSEYRVTYPGTSIWGRLRNRMEDVFIDLNSLAVACILVVAFLLTATIATFSRGGALACVAASLVTLSLTLGGRSGIVRATTLAAVLGGLVIASLTFFELNDGVAARFEELDRTVAEGGEGRLNVWGYTLSALPAYWLTGSGLGTFRFALLPFHTGAPSTWFHHAENIPLEVALDLGIFGLGIVAWFCYWVLAELRKQSATQREPLLLSAAMFSSVAIAVQSLVDFSIVLPGVFVPYLALLGSFMGRCRRVELEQLRQQSLGEAAFDARQRIKMETEIAIRPLRQRIKQFSHTAVAAFSLVCLICGWQSLSGFAAAEQLTDLLDEHRRMAKSGTVPENSMITMLVEHQKGIVQEMEDAVRHYPNHPEIALRAGEVLLNSWRLQAVTSNEWGATPADLKWACTNPQLLSSLMRTTDSNLLNSQPLAQAIEALRNDATGRLLASGALGQFEKAILGCPMDARAVWGAINANAGFLDQMAQHRLLTMIQLLARNNPPVLGKAAIAAFQEGSNDEGVQLLRTLILLSPDILEYPQFFEAVAAHLTIQQLREFLPRDLVSRTRVLEKLPTMPNVSASDFKKLVEEAYARLREAQAKTPEGWIRLAWLAEMAGDSPLQLQLLKLGVMRFRDHLELNMKLAQTYYTQGNAAQAIKTLDDFVRLTASKGEQGQANEQLKKWRESLDHSQ